MASVLKIIYPCLLIIEELVEVVEAKITKDNIFLQNKEFELANVLLADILMIIKTVCIVIKVVWHVWVVDLISVWVAGRGNIWKFYSKVRLVSVRIGSSWMIKMMSINCSWPTMLTISEEWQIISFYLEMLQAHLSIYKMQLEELINYLRNILMLPWPFI